MRTAALADVCEITMGQAPKGDTYNDAGEGYPLVAGAGDFGDLHPAPKKFTTASGVRLSSPGDIIVGIRASIGDKVLADGVYCLGRGVAGLRAMPTLDHRYLWHWVTHAAPALAAKGRGATFLQVNKRDVSEMEIPLPAIEEQRRMAAVLDAADELRAERGQAIVRLDELTQARFVDMFADAHGDEFELGDLVDVQSGLQVTAKRSEMPIEVPYLRVANVHRSSLKLDEIKTIRVSDRELDRTRLEGGDLLVVEGHGNRDEIGRVAMWDGSIDPCVHQNHLIRVRCDRSVVHPRYAEAFLNSRVGRRHLLQAANTTSGLNTISTRDVRGVRISIPKIQEQHSFVEFAEAVDRSRVEQKANLVKLNELFASLQQRAFRGDL